MKTLKSKAFVITTLACVAIMSISAFCADSASLDVTTIMTDAMSNVSTTLLAVISAVVASGIGLLTAKMGITYGIKIVKQFGSRFVS